MLFIYGTKQLPEEKKSKRLLELAQKHFKEEFGCFDLSSDADIGKALIEYSKFPELPQIYLNGRLLGGTDNVEAMLSSGLLLV